MTTEDRLIENIVYFKKFNVDLMDLNVKYYQEIEELKDKILILENLINKIRKYCKESNMTLKSHYFSDILKIIDKDVKE